MKVRELIFWRKLFSIGLIVSFLLSSIAVIPISIVGASPGTPKVFVDPPRVVDTTLTPGKTFSVDINVSEVLDLYHWKILLFFDFPLLNTTAASIEEGEFLKRGGTTTGVSYSVYSTKGIYLECQLTGAVPGVDGNGTLVTVTFNVVGRGDCTLNLRKVYLWDSSAVAITHVKENGYFRNVENLYVDPETIVENPPGTFDLDVKIAEVYSVYGYSFRVNWTGGLLHCAGVTQGDFLALLNPGKVYFDYNVEFDSVFVGETLLGTGVSLGGGSGTLATIHFSMLTTGKSTLPLSETKIIGVTPPNWEDFYLIDHTTQGGYFYTTNPVARFDYEPKTPPACPGQSVTFNATASYDPDGGTITNYFWDFDDNTNDTGVIVEHAYDQADIYTVNLTVTDNTGNKTSTTKDVGIIVRDIAIINVTVTPSAAIPGETVGINVTIKNIGEWSENFNVTAYYDDTAIGTNTTYWTVKLGEEKNVTMSFEWDTSTVPQGTYTIKANATIVSPYEANTTNNEFVYGIFMMVRDIAVTDITFSPTTAIPGTPVDVNVTVRNLGSTTEGFDVSVYYDSTLLETKRVDSLSGGDIEIITFEWNTTGMSYAAYTLKANATILPNEYDTANNELIDGIIIFLGYNLYRYDETVDGETFHVEINTTSSIPRISYRGLKKEIGFNVNVVGPLDREAYFNVTIPVGLLGGSYTVYMNDGPVTPTVLSNGTHAFIYYNYTHVSATYEIRIVGTTAAVAPIASFTASKTQADTGEVIYFNATASYDPDGYIIGYEWDFGDGNINETDYPTITHVYTDAGSFTVTLTVFDNHTVTLRDSYDLDVEITIPPVASFVTRVRGVEATEAFTGETIGFDASASYDPDGGEIVSYEWDFGDGSTGDGVSRGYSYDQPGTYDVWLTVTDDEGSTGNATKTLNIILAHNVRVNNVTASDTTVVRGETVSINVTVENEEEVGETNLVVATSYYDSETGQWMEIGNQSISELLAGAEETLTFEWNTTEVKGGIYPTNATISELPIETDKTDNTLLGDSIKVLERPVAILAWAPLNPVVNETITFKAPLSHDPDTISDDLPKGNITSFTWDFGDVNITTTTETSIAHRYGSAGTYLVTLTVTDNDTLTGTAIRSVDVGKLNSSISIFASPTTITVGSSTTINGSISPIRVGVTVTIEYRSTGGTWDTLETVTTDENGRYSYDWTPTTAEIYEVKASWMGDGNTEAAESGIETIVVEEASAAVPVLYVVAVIAAAVVISTSLLYFLRIRKKG